MLIEAPTRSAAEAKARRMNVLVERLEALSEPAPETAPERPAQPAAPNWSWAAVVVVAVLGGAATYWSNPHQGPGQPPA